jgi:hypothetical protein
MEQLSIYTQEFFWPGKLKFLLKKFLGKSFGGPTAVVQSLRIGLGELGINYNFNSIVERGSLAGVLTGVNVLKWVIEAKKQGKLKKILAGTNLVILPQDEGGILADPAVDGVLVPCLWVQKAYEKNAPSLAGKIHIWPAGVDFPEDVGQAQKEFDFLIFNKFSSDIIYKPVASFFTKRGFKIARLDYGNFKQDKYFDLLKKAKALVYLGSGESQGIAMFEAWSFGLPALVYGKHDPSGQSPSASPYLTPQTGMFFERVEDLEKIIPEFLSANFQPREFIFNNFTHKRRAERYLEIIKSV